PAAATIWATGAVIIGGGSDRELTAMSVACGGGTSSIRRRTHPGSPQGYRRLRPENCFRLSNDGSSASCSSFASLTASPPHCSQRPRRIVLLILWRGAWQW